MEKENFKYFNDMVISDLTATYKNKFIHRLQMDSVIVSTHSSPEFWNRYDGPCYYTMGGLERWWINDCDVDMLIRSWAEENDIDLDNLSEDDINLIKLYWSSFSY